VPSGPSLLNDSDSVQMAPDGTFMPMLMSIAIFEFGMVRPLPARSSRHRLAGLVGEEIHGVTRVVPQQVVRPAARLAERVHVRARGRSRSARPSAAPSAHRPRSSCASH
jgi:hypothetical protein